MSDIKTRLQMTDAEYLGKCLDALKAMHKNYSNGTPSGACKLCLLASEVARKTGKDKCTECLWTIMYDIQSEAYWLHKVFCGRKALEECGSSMFGHLRARPNDVPSLCKWRIEQIDQWQKKIIKELEGRKDASL